ncbi:zinc dependent phospholipase C family protein [Oceanirhabdus sp. W0125-5]|uniref:zinc dependent phospholipase C family protein n=1 Tax=Oceanirhabdus sp. W0125-5 TaxID=2999116 RepID=UPI0022F305FA|nr:zinc dependent phospholipase C family protein [Oceanirhabdus sp. W0125-5]WBW96672.1 zinc dependent phospholipase C family protein [Oceanirhabdus sp. W0125-5]
MATWVAHIRVAERLLEKFKLVEEMFLAGNIAPDSGVPNEDHSVFTPGKKITHWLDKSLKNEEYLEINSESFFDKYIKGRELEKKEKSFLIGYYTHLLTDIEWSKMHRKIINQDKEFKEELTKDKNFIWTVKKDWYGLDYKYIIENENCIFNKVYKHIKEIPDYLEYFPKGAFINQKEAIVDYYTEKNEHKFNKEFKYLTEDMMDKFVEECSAEIIEILNKKCVL